MDSERHAGQSEPTRFRDRRRRRRARQDSRFRAWWASQAGAATMGFALALVGAVAMAMMVDDWAHLGPEQPTAEATVTDTWRSGRGGTSMEFTFMTESGQTVVTSDAAGDRAIGDTFTVRYHPSDPEFYVVPVADEAFTSVMIAIVGVLTSAALVYGVLGVLGRLPRWALNRRVGS